jgi:hypothetical protein
MVLDHEKLLDSRMQRLSSRVHKFSMAHGLPRLHGCIWDRHCRYWGGPRRIAVYWKRHEWWVDLPGYDPPCNWRSCSDSTLFEVPGSWQLLPQFHHHARPERTVE